MLDVAAITSFYPKWNIRPMTTVVEHPPKDDIVKHRRNRLRLELIRNREFKSVQNCNSPAIAQAPRIKLKRLENWISIEKKNESSTASFVWSIDGVLQLIIILLSFSCNVFRQVSSYHDLYNLITFWAKIYMNGRVVRISKYSRQLVRLNNMPVMGSIPK